MSRAPQGLLWVTNVPTPYRTPLWSALGEHQELTVALLADSEPNREWQVELDRNRYRVVSLNARPLGRSHDSIIYGPSLKLLSLIARKPRAVVLDGWESPAYLTARWWARLCHVPLIASYRSTERTHRFRSGPIAALRRWFFQGADLVLTAGKASTEAVTAMGVPRSRIVEAFNTVDVERFINGTGAVRQSSAPRPGHHFIYVGQFIERKNIPTLLHAFGDVRAQDDTLTLVGSGPLDGQLRSLAGELGLTDAVRFTGHLDGAELLITYASANTLILPSTEEVWGLVVNEALASGLHAVVSTACGIAESIDHMPGVFPAEPSRTGLAWAMRLSRSAWQGPIAEHPVTLHTPAELSQVVITATNRASSTDLSS